MNKIESRRYLEPINPESENISREDYEAQCIENRLHELIEEIEREYMKRRMEEINAAPAHTCTLETRSD